LASLHSIQAQARGGASVDCFWEWTEDGAPKLQAAIFGASHGSFRIAQSKIGEQ